MNSSSVQASGPVPDTKYAISRSSVFVQTAVDIVADGFVEALLGDGEVNHFFAGTDKSKHKRHLGNFVAMAFGKPDAKYSFSKAGVDNLSKVHAGMGITARHFGIVADHLQKVMLVSFRTHVNHDLVNLSCTDHSIQRGIQEFSHRESYHCWPTLLALEAGSDKLDVKQTVYYTIHAGRQCS